MTHCVVYTATTDVYVDASIVNYVYCLWHSSCV